MLLTHSIKSVISEHALSDLTVECCGLLVQTPDGPIAWPCPNDSPTPEKAAVISPNSYASAPGEVIGVYHSHIDKGDRDFSIADIKVARQENLIMVLYYLPTNSWQYYNPAQKHPYLGREWHTAYRNCFTLMQDFYAKEFSHKIADFYPIGNIKTESIGYLENLPSQGFRRLDKNEPIKFGDLILIYNGCAHPNHCIMAIDTQYGIHHNLGVQSGRIRFDGLPDIHSHWRLSHL